MDLVDHYKMLARYNRIANGRLYACCEQLNVDEYKRARSGSFGSIHALLNHVLLSDRIWMARFLGQGQTTPPLNTVLHDELPALRTAREAEDMRIEQFFAGVVSEFFDSGLTYKNSRGIQYTENAAVAAAHFFNHQTHHRGQLHVMLSQTAVPSPSLDLHRIINP